MHEDEGRYKAAGKRFDILPCWEDYCLRMQPLAQSLFWFLLLQVITVLYVTATQLIWVLSFPWNCPKYSCPVRALCFSTFWQFAWVSLPNPTSLLLPCSFQPTVVWVHLFTHCSIPAFLRCSLELPAVLAVLPAHERSSGWMQPGGWGLLINLGGW